MAVKNRFVLAGVAIVAAAMLTNSPARAQSTITLARTGAEPHASGQATLSDVAPYAVLTQAAGFYTYYYWYVDAGQLTLHCDGLTPGATYRVGPTAVNQQTNRKGQVSLTNSYSFVTASSTGTIDLGIGVTYLAGFECWQVIDPGGWAEEWVFLGGDTYPYKVSVDRKRGSKYTVVLEGTFPQ